MTDETSTAEARRLLSAATTIVAVFSALLLYFHGCMWEVCVAVPVCGLVVVALTWPVSVALFAGGLFAIIVFQVAPLASSLDGQSVVVVGSIVLLLSLVCRLPQITRWPDPWMRARTTRMYAERMRFEPPRMTMAWGQLASLVWIGVAISLAIWLARPLQGTLTLGPHIGVIPEVYFGMKIVFLFAIVVFVVRGCLNYRRLSTASPDLASTTLRRVLWNWQGGEARRVARAKRKLDRLV